MLKKLSINFIILMFLLSCGNNYKKKPIIAIQTDFTRVDNYVATMYGVALDVDPDLKIYDLSHNIPSFNVWEASIRLNDVYKYWPKGTVFVSVVDPGVGTERKSVVAKTKDNYYIVTPDNGTLTFIADGIGIEEVREIDETINKRPNAIGNTFHGRDIYAYTAARLASGVINFEQVGKSLGTNINRIEYTKPKFENNTFYANIPVLDTQYGNILTSLPYELMIENGINIGDIIKVKIYNNTTLIWEGNLPIVNTFGDVNENEALALFDSEGTLSFAINMGSFANKYDIKSGPNWNIEITKK